MTKRWLIAVALAALLAPCIAQAASPFDGPWSGQINAMGGGFRQHNCPIFQGTIAIFIQDGSVVRGRGETANSKPPVHGAVAADGTFTGTMGPSPLTGKFTGDSFTGQWAYTGDPSCIVSVTMIHKPAQP